MTDTPGRRGTHPGDPTAERASDPVPDGGDLVDRENPRRGDTPRRYDDDKEGDPVMPSADSTLKTRI
jgi:hypothetical protein